MESLCAAVYITALPKAIRSRRKMHALLNLCMSDMEKVPVEKFVYLGRSFCNQSDKNNSIIRNRLVPRPSSVKLMPNQQGSALPPTGLSIATSDMEKVPVEKFVYLGRSFCNQSDKNNSIIRNRLVPRPSSVKLMPNQQGSALPPTGLSIATSDMEKVPVEKFVYLGRSFCNQSDKNNSIIRNRLVPRPSSVKLMPNQQGSALPPTGLSIATNRIRT